FVAIDQRNIERHALDGMHDRRGVDRSEPFTDAPFQPITASERTKNARVKDGASRLGAELIGQLTAREMIEIGLERGVLVARHACHCLGDYSSSAVTQQDMPEATHVRLPKCESSPLRCLLLRPKPCETDIQAQRTASAITRSASVLALPLSSMQSTCRCFAASFQACSRSRMRSAEPTSAISSTRASGTAATASALRPMRKASWIRTAAASYPIRFAASL